MTDITSTVRTRPHKSGAPAMQVRAEISLSAWLTWILAVMALAAITPFDASYDVAHYHLHNGWAAWNGRIDKDFAPADMHSFINPAYNMLVWWLIERLPGPAVNAVLAIPAALVLPALYYLSRTLSVIMTGNASRNVCLVIAFLGFAAQGQISVFASVRNDAWGAAAFLGALALVLTPQGRLASWPRLVIASLLLGSMLGMKFTNLPYAAAFGLFVILLARDWGSRIRATTICAMAGLAATLVFAGPYAWLLWERFSNPVFPMANDLFQSPLGPTEFDAYSRRKPGLLMQLVYPFAFTIDGSIIGSSADGDIRFLMSYLGALVLLIIGGLRLRAGEPPAWLRPVGALCLALLMAMMFWMSGFSVLRYLLAAWMLGPLILAAVLWAMTGTPELTARTRRYSAALGLAMLLSTDPTNVRRVAWPSADASYISGDLGDTSRFENAFILFAGDSPSAFLAPLFPETATLGAVAPQDYFRPALANYRPQLREAIAQAPERPVYGVMFAIDRPAHDRATVLKRIEVQEGLFSDARDCEPIPNNFDTGMGGWFVCRLYRAGEAPFAP